jgi:uncharacterized protein (TIGR02145 family)
MKLNKISKAIAASALTIIAATPMSSFATTIEGAINDHVPLGTAYNSLTGEFLNFQTVKGQVKIDGNVNTSIKSYQNMSYEEVSSRLSGDVVVKADFPVVKAEASADIALETASDAFSSNWVISVINEARSEVLRPIGNAAGLTLSDQGQTIANKNLADSALLQAAGDEFITEIEYSTQLFVSMKAEYLSTADKTAINGAISVDFAVGNVSGDLSYLSDEQKQSVRITVRAHQFGGDPLALLSILPNNIITCDLTNFTPCETLFEEAIKYAKGIGAYSGNGFKDQVAEISNSNVVGYQTETYAQNFGTFSLAQSSIVDTDNNTSIINDLEDEYIEQLEFHSRATGLLGKSLAYLNDTQRAALRNTAVESIKNAEALRDLVNYCSVNVYNNFCTTYIADNCPATATSRSCLNEYATDVFNQDNNSVLNVSLSEYSQLVDASNLNTFYVQLFKQPNRTGGNIFDSTGNTLSLNANGQLSSSGTLGVFSPDSSQVVTTEFILKTNKKPKSVWAGTMSSSTPNPGLTSLSQYQDGQWNLLYDHQSNMPAYNSSVWSEVNAVNGYYYYLVKMQGVTQGMVETYILDGSTNGSTHTYFYIKPVSDIPMTTGFNAEGTPFYFTTRNINVDKDINSNDIGWCPTGSGLQRGTNSHCLDSGRMYTWANAAKACEAYSAAHEGSTGLVWSLPTAADINLLTARVEQDSGAGKAGSYLKGYDFALVSGAHNTTDAYGFSAQETGYIANGWTTSNAPLYGNNTYGINWMKTQYSSSSGNVFGFIYNSDGLRRWNLNKDWLLAARCIGKYVK